MSSSRRPRPEEPWYISATNTMAEIQRHIDTLPLGSTRTRLQTRLNAIDTNVQAHRYRPGGIFTDRTEFNNRRTRIAGNLDELLRTAERSSLESWNQDIRTAGSNSRSYAQARPSFDDPFGPDLSPPAFWRQEHPQQAPPRARTKSMTSKGAKGLRKLLSDAFGASQHNIHSSGLSAGLPPPVPQLPMSFQGGYSQAQAPPQWSPPEWVEYGPPPTATLPPYGGPPIATLARRLSLARAQRFFVLPDTGETIFVDDVVENGRWVGYAYWDRVRSQWCGWW